LTELLQNPADVMKLAFSQYCSKAVMPQVGMELQHSASTARAYLATTGAAFMAFFLY